MLSRTCTGVILAKNRQSFALPIMRNIEENFNIGYLCQKASHYLRFFVYL